MKALSVSIYRNKNHVAKNQTDNISDKYDHLLIICDEGNYEIDLNNPPENLVEIKSSGNSDYRYVEPYNATGWYSFGGSYSGSSDARFLRMSRHLLPIHDRKEW